MSLLKSIFRRRKAVQVALEEEEEQQPLGPEPELEEWAVTVPITRIRTIVTGLDTFLRERAGATACYAIGQVQPKSVKSTGHILLDNPECLEHLHLLFEGHPGIEVLWCGIPRIWPYRLVPPAKATHFLVKLQAGAVLDLFRLLLRDFSPDPTVDYAAFNQVGSSDFRLEAEAMARVEKGGWFYWTRDPTSLISKPDHFLYHCRPFLCGSDALDAEGDLDVSGETGEEWIRYGPEAPEALKQLVARESSGC